MIKTILTLFVCCSLFFSLNSSAQIDENTAEIDKQSKKLQSIHHDLIRDFRDYGQKYINIMEKAGQRLFNLLLTISIIWTIVSSVPQAQRIGYSCR